MLLASILNLLTYVMYQHALYWFRRLNEVRKRTERRRSFVCSCVGARHHARHGRAPVHAQAVRRVGRGGQWRLAYLAQSSGVSGTHGACNHLPSAYSIATDTTRCGCCPQAEIAYACQLLVLVCGLGSSDSAHVVVSIVVTIVVIIALFIPLVMAMFLATVTAVDIIGDLDDSDDGGDDDDTEAGDDDETMNPLGDDDDTEAGDDDETTNPLEEDTRSD